MLTNERVQRLIDTDRQALVELMALVAQVKLADGDWEYTGDLTIETLLEDVGGELACSDMSKSKRFWLEAIDKWDAEMRPLIKRPIDVEDGFLNWIDVLTQNYA